MGFFVIKGLLTVGCADQTSVHFTPVAEGNIIRQINSLLHYRIFCSSEQGSSDKVWIVETKGFVHSEKLYLIKQNQSLHVP